MDLGIAANDDEQQEPKHKNSVGRLTEIHDATGMTRYEYNDRGQITEKAYSIDGVAYSQGYAYNRLGQLTAMTYPNGETVHYDRNHQGQLAAIHYQNNEQVQTVAKHFSHKPFGPLQSFTYGNNSQLHMQYDQNYRVTDIRVDGELGDQDPANDILYDVGIVYDLASNITEINDALNPHSSEQFEYDDSYRLTNAKGQYGDIHYQYDGVGNRLSREKVQGNQRVKETYAYAQDSNRLLSVTSAGSQGNNQPSHIRDLRYDATGNIVHDANQNEKTMAYNARNRLELVTLENGDKAVYQYNAKGQRVSKTVKGETTHFHYSIGKQLLVETRVEQGIVSTQRQYIYGASQRLATIENHEILFVVNDHLGTPQQLINGAQNVVWREQSTPFGEMVLAATDGQQPLRFPGQYSDLETGYNYNYFRDYDPTLGRYIQSDPIGLMGGVNTFGYVRGNPILRYDPYGLVDYVDAAISTGGIIFGGAEFAAGSFGLVVNSALVGTGVGAPIGVPGWLGSSALVAHGSYNILDSYQSLMNALNETNHAGPLSQFGQALFGESGAEYGKVLDTALSVRGALTSGKGFIDGLLNGGAKASDAHGVISTGKKYYDSHGNELNYCPVSR